MDNPGNESDVISLVISEKIWSHVPNTPLKMPGCADLSSQAEISTCEV